MNDFIFISIADDRGLKNRVNNILNENGDCLPRILGDTTSDFGD